jgi:hypothetical protein
VNDSLVVHSVATGRAVAGVLTLLSVVVVAPVVGAAVTFALGEAYLGRAPSMGASLRRAFGIIVPLTGTMLLIPLIAGAPLVLPVASAVLLRLTGGLPGRSGLVLLVALIALSVAVTMYLALAFMLSTQVMMLEQTFGLRALRRSRFLMQGNLRRASGIVALGGLIVGVVGGMFQLALHFVPFVGPVGTGIAMAAATAYTSAVHVVLYFDIRCRKEAFDLEHLARLVAGADEPFRAAIAPAG